MDYLQEKVKKLPLQPGCYIFKNSIGDVIYVGKSKALRNRVSQYFHNIDAKEGKYQRLSREIADFEYILTDTERDALIMEFKLIRQYLPKYNVLMKRRKRYAYICITVNDEYPTISVEKEPEPGRGSYFGFFSGQEQAAETIRMINSIWKTPVCGKVKFSAGHRPCLNYHLKNCCAPCAQKPDQQEYRRKIVEICECLRGNQRKMRKQLEEYMNQAVGAMEYEKAADIRDQIAALEALRKRSRRLNTAFEEQRVFLFFRAFRESEFSLFYILDGTVRKRFDFSCDEFDASVRFVHLAEEIFCLKEDIPDDQDGLLADSLGQIYADKYYVTVPLNASPSRISKLLEKGYREFTDNS